LRQQLNPNDSQSAVQNYLGETLLALKRFDEAKPLLVAAAEKLIAGGDKPLPWIRDDAIRSVVKLYEQTNRPQKAGEWRAQLGAPAR
jgi:hypothetical protein